jgi:hypothetical protein
VKRLVIYSREWRDEGVLKLYRAFSVLLQKHRVYVIEKVLELSPKRALVLRLARRRFVLSAIRDGAGAL